MIVTAKSRCRPLDGLHAAGPDLPDAHTVEAIESCEDEIMLVEMPRRQRELQQQRHERKMSSAPPGERP